MNIWHLSREIGGFFVCFFSSPYHSWVPLQLGLPQICPAVGWGSHRWRQPERCRTRRTAWAGQPATAARSHSLMRWNPVAWRGMHTHAHRGRWACRKRAKGTLHSLLTALNSSVVLAPSYVLLLCYKLHLTIQCRKNMNKTYLLNIRISVLCTCVHLWN